MNNKKNVIWSTIGISCNVFISLFFLIITARINTIKDVGIFSFAFSIANTMYVLGSFGGRVYQVTDSEGEFEDNDYIGFRILSSISMIILTVLFVIVNRYDLYKSSIFILLVGFKFMESISDVYYAVMQKNNKLYSVGISMTFKAVVGIVLFTIMDYFTENLIVSICMIILVNLFTFICYDLAVVRNVKRVHPVFNITTLKRLLKTCIYFFAFTFLSSLVINIPRYAVDLYSTEEIQAIYGIIVMPATSIALFGQFILQPILVSLSKLYSEKKIKEFSSMINKGVLLLIGFTIVCEIGAYILGIPVLSLVYGIDLTPYKLQLLVVIFGALFSTIAAVYSTALTTMRMTKEQLIIYFANTTFAVLISFILVYKVELLGGVLSYVGIMFFQYISYTILYKFRLNREKKELSYE